MIQMATARLATARIVSTSVGEYPAGDRSANVAPEPSTMKAAETTLFAAIMRARASSGELCWTIA